MNERLQAALSMASNGWKVFPVKEGAKAPLTATGFKEASGDARMIREWWNSTPDANIGIATGAVSGLVVVDVDVKNGVDGRTAATKLDLNSTLVATTPTGGLHYYYQYPGKKISCRVGIESGIDIRADGGYVVAPPSVLPNGCYAWKLSGTAPAMPLKLMDLLDSPRSDHHSLADIPEGKRNNTLFDMACELRRKGLESAEILTVIKQRNDEKCSPPLPEREVIGIVASACRNTSSARESRVSTTDILQLIEGLGCELFTEGPDYYASIARNGHRETWDLDGSEFGELINAELYRKSKKIPPAQSVTESLNTLRGRAKYEGLRYPVSYRAAQAINGYRIDLGNLSWESVLISPEGISAPEASEIRFRRGSLTQELTVDTSSKKQELPDLLGRLLNVRKTDLPLVVTWMLDAWRPDTAYPILEITGEQGSSKSTTQDRIRNLVDPSAAPLLAAPRSSEDIVIAARSNLVLSYNNISGMKRDFQDFLCNVSTGGSITVRKLYSNFGAATVEIKRPIILNGIESVGTNPDFVDRVISIDLPRIAAGARKGDAHLQEEFRDLRSKATGALFDLFSSALGRLPELQIDVLPRMADFAKLGEAICQVMRWPPFASLYAKNRESAALATLESSPVARAVQELMEQRTQRFEDTCKELYRLLSSYRGDSSHWPQSERALSGQLRRYAPVLALTGIEVAFREHRSNRGKIVCIKRVNTPSLPSLPSPIGRAA